MKSVQNHMRRELKAENHLEDIMKPDEAIDGFEMMPMSESVDRLNESRNYCYGIVFQEINEINCES